MIIQVTALGADEWSRPMLRNVQNGQIYVDIGLGDGVPDWHTVTDEGEPLARLRKDIVFEIIDLGPDGEDGDDDPVDVLAEQERNYNRDIANSLRRY